MLLSSQVQRRPVAVPIEGDGIAGLVARIDFLEGVEVHLTGRRVGEEAEGDFIFGVGFREKVVEDTPVRESDAALVVAIGDVEQNRVLVALDLVLDGSQLSTKSFKPSGVALLRRFRV